jgi:hypothetical protein
MAFLERLAETDPSLSPSAVLARIVGEAMKSEAAPANPSSRKPRKASA